MLSHMKRTTLILDPSLYAELRRRAAAEGRTLTDVVEHALRAGLSARGAGRRARVALPSYDLGPFLADPADAGRTPRARGGTARSGGDP
jgi:plasmid stability protein